jgi:hypothetical protein
MNIYKNMLGIIVSVLLLAGCGGKEPGRYYDQLNKFSIKFPAGWKIQAVPAGSQTSEVLTASSPDETATTSIRIEKFALGMALPIYSRELADKLGAHPPSTGGKVGIDNRPAYWMLSDSSSIGPEFTTFYYCFTMEDKIYSIVFVSGTDYFSTRRPIFEEIAKSFKFGN